jgi:hypothetical protein
MGPAPEKPPPLGLAPKPGYTHPKFATVGPRDVPQGNYQSQIDTRSPINDALLKKIGATPRIQAGGMSMMGSGGQTLDAFGRSLNDQISSALLRSADEVNVEGRGRAENARAQDVLAQRQNFMDTHRLDRSYQVFGNDILADFDMKVKELAAYYEREKKNSEAMVTAALMSMLGSLL